MAVAAISANWFYCSDDILVGINYFIKTLSDVAIYSVVAILFLQIYNIFV